MTLASSPKSVVESIASGRGKTMGKATRRRGSSKAGRPRKSGARFPSGKLRAPAPNEALLARRKAGDADAGEHPMDFALSNGWVTEAQHKAATSYREAFNRAHIGGPRMSCGSLPEVVPAEALRMNWSQMSGEDITQVWDQVFNLEETSPDPDKLEAEALARWRLLNTALTGEEREELFKVCVLGSWPFWMPKVSMGRTLGSQDERRRQALLKGLGAVSNARRKPKAKPTIVSVEFTSSRKGKAEYPVRYITEDGQEITPASERGVPFEATILRKRA